MKLPRNSVGAVQLGAGAVTSRALKNGSVAKADLAKSALPAAGATGARGPSGTKGDPGVAGAKGDVGQTGTPGTPGAAGSALAFTYLYGAVPTGQTTGLTAPDRSKLFTDANVTHPADGRWCLRNLSFTPRSVITSLDSGASGAAYLTGGGLGTLPSCPAGTQAYVTVFNPAAGTFVNAGGVYVIVN